MRDLILDLPRQLDEGIAAARPHAPKKQYRRFIICAMGGSSVAGEMLSMIRDNVVIHWDYGLPANIQDGDLIVCISWSGNTEEVLSSYDAARSKGSDTFAITTGGKLADRARSENTPLVLLTSRSSVPRAAEGYMVGALFGALGLEQELPTGLEPAKFEQKGEEIAEALAGRIAVIYSAYPWRKAAGWFKTLLNENAKLHAFAANLPSAAHNELAGWSGPYQNTAVPVFIRDAADSPEFSRTLDAMLAILEKMGYDGITLELAGTTVPEKALNAYILGLWTSVHAAQARGVDPADTTLIEEFKKLKG